MRIVEPTPSQPRAGALIAGAIKALWTRPFLPLLALSLLFSAADSSSALAAESELLLSLVLAILSMYVQIAMILAAADERPAVSADKWIKTAFRRRCLVRYVAVSVLMYAMVGIGLLAFVVGGIIVAGMVGLSSQAVVLEGRTPIDAIARSLELTKPVRRTVEAIFGTLILLPSVGWLIAYFTVLPQDAYGALLIGSVIVIVPSTAGTIALTRLFVGLGGETRPAEVIAAARRT